MESYLKQMEELRNEQKRRYEEHKKQEDQKRKEENLKKQREMITEKYSVENVAVRKIQSFVRTKLLQASVNMTEEEINMIPGIYRVHLGITEDNLVQPEKPVIVSKQEYNPMYYDDSYFVDIGEEGIIIPTSNSDEEIQNAIRLSMLQYDKNDIQGVELDEDEMIENRAIMESLGLDTQNLSDVKEDGNDATSLANPENIVSFFKQCISNLTKQNKSDVHVPLRHVPLRHVPRVKSRRVRKGKTEMQIALEESLKNISNEPVIDDKFIEHISDESSVEEDIINQIMMESANEAGVSISDEDQIMAQMIEESKVCFDDDAQTEAELMNQIMKKSIDENKNFSRVCIDLRVYGPDPYQPIYVNDIAYYLDAEQVKKVKDDWNKINPETAAGEQFHQKMEFIKNMAIDMKLLEDETQ
jgi:hypothetical protein